MSIKQTLSAIRALGLTATYDYELREFCITLKGNCASAYFTDDRDDALATARHMAGN
jgi:hypothetical protein